MCFPRICPQFSPSRILQPGFSTCKPLKVPKKHYSSGSRDLQAVGFRCNPCWEGSYLPKQTNIQHWTNIIQHVVQHVPKNQHITPNHSNHMCVGVFLFPNSKNPKKNKSLKHIFLGEIPNNSPKVTNSQTHQPFTIYRSKTGEWGGWRNFPPRRLGGQFQTSQHGSDHRKPLHLYRSCRAAGGDQHGGWGVLEW